MPRIFLRLRWLILCIAFLSAVLIAGAWWAASSPNALQWLVSQAVQRSNGALAFDGVSGSLLGRVQVRKLVYADSDLRITLDDVGLALSRAALLQRRLEFVTLDAAVVDIYIPPSDKPAQAPKSLALPFDIKLDHVRIGQLRFKGQTIKQLSFNYRGGKNGQALSEISADTDWGHASGGMTIAALRPFALSGQLRLDQAKEWNAQVALGGNLLKTDISARMMTRGAVADATMRLSAFDAKWLHDLRAHAENINTAAFDDVLPQSAITIDMVGSGSSNDWPAGRISIKNALPGAIVDNRLPLRAVSADYALRDVEHLVLTSIAADLGAAGALSGSAHITRAPRETSRLDLAIRALDLHALHPPLRTTRMNSALKAEFAGDTQNLQLNVAQRDISLALSGTRRGDAITLREFLMQAGTGAVRGSGEFNLAKSRPFTLDAQLSQLDPAAFGDYPSAAITGQLNVSGTLAPQWRNRFSLVFAQSLFRGEKLAGNARGEISARGADKLVVDLSVGANTLRANGSYGQSGDALDLELNAPQLAQLDPRISGAITGKVRVTGDVKQPAFDMDMMGTALLWQEVRIDAAHLQASGTLAKHIATLTARGSSFDLEARMEGGATDHNNTGVAWSGVLASLQNRGVYSARLISPMPLSYMRGRYSAGPAQLDVDSGRVVLNSFAWHDGELQTSGQLANFPAAPLLQIAGLSAPRTSLRLGGTWSVSASPLLNGEITFARESGDIVPPGDNSAALGLEQLGVKLRFLKGAADVTLDLVARSVSGNAHATATSLSPDGRLALAGKFDIASLRVLDSVIGPQALLRGSATVNVVGSGTLRAPLLGGRLVADNLGFEAPQYGIRLNGGTLRAELDDKTLTLREFSIRGDEGTLSATGTMDRAEGSEARLVWRVSHLRLLNSPDVRLKLDGNGTLAVADKKIVLRGALTADEGRFEFNAPKAPTLGSDVVVVGRSKTQTSSAMRTSFQSRLLDVDMVLDAGRRLHIVGAGLDTDLRGKVNLKTNPQGLFEARGELSSVNGIYFVFGQRLQIDRGRLLFDGPVDNPALDIVAKRKGLAVEAGVEVTGTVRVPNVQLISDPPVADSEKLAWLTLGHGLQDSTGADLALLQTAATALIGTGEGVPLTQRVANEMGLDELSLKGGGQAGTQVAAVGKRLSEKLYLEYQQGLAAASSVLRLSYTLSRSLSLRLDAGYMSGLGLYFTRSYD